MKRSVQVKKSGDHYYVIVNGVPQGGHSSRVDAEIEAIKYKLFGKEALHTRTSWLRGKNRVRS